jgi:hypothetical protein
VKLTLGSEVVDAVTGFSGTAVSRHEYIGGYVAIGVQGDGFKADGTPADIVFIDERNLRTVDGERIAP